METATRLLDLPDEALALLEDGSLTEGHGRALLLAGDHAVRRRLARSAVDEGWSVRTLEARAREAGVPAVDRTSARRGAAALHPDQEAAVAAIAETLGGALGTEVRVRPSGTGYRVELELSTIEEAAALAGRLRPATGATLPPLQGD